jgi:cytochrome c5
MPPLLRFRPEVKETYENAPGPDLGIARRMQPFPKSSGYTAWWERRTGREAIVQPNCDNFQSQTGGYSSNSSGNGTGAICSESNSPSAPGAIMAVPVYHSAPFKEDSNMKSATIVLALTLSLGSAYAAGDATAGKAVYEKACKACHGATGTANPGMAKAMNVTIQDLGSSEVQAMSDADLKKVVTDGKGKMKPISSVTGKSVDDVVAYVRTLKK